MTRAEFFTCSQCGKSVEDKTLANMVSLGLPCLCGAIPASFRQANGAGEYITWYEISKAAEHAVGVIGVTGEPLICKCGSFYFFRIVEDGFQCTNPDCERVYREETKWVERSGWSK